uniref:Uncharacterized protein n=1 Tax=Caenorhabditis tropicalis TaxID=1561998 RepID=A0A1I7T0F7_9PELO
MASNPGEEFTNVEKEIIEELSYSDSLKKLYIMLRKTETNASILLALPKFKLHEFEFSCTENFSEKQEGEIFMEDLEAINRDLDGEETHCILPKPGVIKFGLWNILNEQISTPRKQTLCFGLNTCQLDDDNVVKNHFEMLEDNFRSLVRNNRTPDPFMKKYVMFPVFYRCRPYVTLFIDPIGAVHRIPERKVPTPVMIHFGTQPMDDYKQIIVPRILAVMQFFVNMYMPTIGYLDLKVDRFQVSEHTVPARVDTFENPIQLFYIVHQIVSAIGSEDFESEISKFGEDSGKTETGIKEVQDKVAHWIRHAVMKGTKKSAAHLYEKREKIAAHQKAQREKNTPVALAVVKKEEEDQDPEDLKDVKMEKVKQEDVKTEDVKMEED